ncbi:undecaprenyl pyrophosphate synthetase UppS [methanogenic archaeon mixed culture ISO4-G1]|nr:undecaprenyl pyrophosphate synthetase UppS [methanogenic archaeon mixed culture ISO4-G1]
MSGAQSQKRDEAYAAYEAELEKEVLSGEIPGHMAIIMDGNRRYAEETLHIDAFEGHRLGKDKLDQVIHWCLRIGIRNLTVYAFSTENFHRAKKEVGMLMDLMEKSLYELADDEEVHKLQVRVKVIGDRSLLPENVLKAVENVENRTAGYSNYTFTMAIAYGGRQDIVNAVREIASKVKSEELDIEDIDEDLMRSYISTKEMPDPDLVLRTSGEIRLSNFLLWQMAYSELYFTDVNWPGFEYVDLLEAVRTYQQRKRRYGV